MATIKIQQTKSRIGAPIDQKRTLDALGLTKSLKRRILPTFAVWFAKYTTW